MSDEIEKLKMQLERCQAHARFLNESLKAMAADLPFDAHTLARYRSAPSGMAYLDKFAYRFGRLQDTISRQLLPLILEVVKEPLPEEATFMEKLDRLERPGVVPSVEQWDEIRELRNALTHDYPEEAERPAATINQAMDAARSLVEILDGNAQWLKGTKATRPCCTGPGWRWVTWRRPPQDGGCAWHRHWDAVGGDRRCP